MPSNVSYEYENALEEYNQATSDEAKLAALLKVQSTAPSHKGGENLRKDISKKISLLKKSMEKKKKQDKKRGGGTSIAVRKDGIGQITLLGMPNSGKSTFLNKITDSDTAVAVYPFTTKTPVVGMMDYFGAKIQLVELPAIVEGSNAGKADGPQVLSIARNSDAIIIIAKNKEEGAIVLKELELNGISLNKEKPGCIMKKAIAINAFEEHDIPELKEKIFLLLDKIVVFTKKPGVKADVELPFALHKDATVKDFAEHLHKDFAKKLKYAKVWGSSKFDGQRVAKDYNLKNKDIVEVFA